MIVRRVRLLSPIFCTLCLLGVAGPATADCEPIDGIRGLLKPGGVLLLGELHGTRESPSFTRDIACHAAGAGLDVVVALELSPSLKDDVDAFLESEGSPADREALLAGRSWQSSYQDGRNSRAMADLIDGVARLRREGLAVRVGLFDAKPPGGGQAREHAMAANLASSIEALPEALHIVLTGNAHSRITPGNRRSPDYEPMGYLLSRRIGAERVTALNVSHTGGSAWICAPDCGVVDGLRGHGSGESWKIEIDDDTRPAGHDGWYNVGTLTASLPAVGDHEEPVPAPAPAELPVSQTAEADDDFPLQTSEMLEPFQGSWKAYQYGSVAWTIRIDEQQFRGVLGPDDWYEGKIRLRPDVDPAQIDFMIEDCRCGYRGMTSKGIYHVEEGAIALAAPQPGSPRPTLFGLDDGRTVELRRAKTEKPK